MSSGIAFAPGFGRGLKTVLRKLERMPPPPNQSEVCRFTKPPNDDA